MINYIKGFWILLSILALFSNCQLSNSNDRNLNHSENDKARIVFIDSLINQMTLDEKIGQTVLFSANWDISGPKLDSNYVNHLKNGMVGGLFNIYTAQKTRELQKIAVEDTRLGIPLLIGYDVIHGYKTIFPIPLGEAASWDMELIEKASRISAEEASAAGINWTYAPMIDIARDPRWGRVSEGSGEDVFLTSQIAKAKVRGFQGDDLSNYNTLLACAKHFAAYGAAQAGRDYFTVDMSERELRTTYLPPFKAALGEGVATFMTAFNELNGVPASGNKFLLTDILRNEWGFEGFVVTDYTSMNEMIPHGFSKDEKQAGEQAINAGVDMDMQGGIYFEHLKDLILEGKVSEKRLNEATRAILDYKYRLGLFEDPYRYSNENREKVSMLKPEFLELSKNLAIKSMVLLKNNSNLLPLNKKQKIALIGPLAKDDYNIIGPWSAQGDRKGTAISVYEGFENLLGSKLSFSYAKGCEINSEDRSGFNQAVQIAKQAEVVVMVVGELSNMSGEAASRTNLDLPGIQKELIQEIKKTGKPLILVLMNGRPLTLEIENKLADAILEAWWPGTMGGAAIADIVFGHANPSGKLPITFPRNIGQIPLYYNIKNTGRPYEIDGKEQRFRSRYLDVDNSPLFPFGFGLSYTFFEYSELTLDKLEYDFEDEIKIRVKIKNTGKYAGEETVQLYIRDMVASATRPLKELKAFRKIYLEPNQSQNVTFNLKKDDLAFFTFDMSYKTEPGDFKIYVGTNSQEVLEAGFTLK